MIKSQMFEQSLDNTIEIRFIAVILTKYLQNSSSSPRQGIGYHTEFIMLCSDEYKLYCPHYKFNVIEPTWDVTLLKHKYEYVEHGEWPVVI